MKQGLIFFWPLLPVFVAGAFAEDGHHHSDDGGHDHRASSVAEVKPDEADVSAVPT